MSDLTARQFKITVESVYGQLVPQVVEASSLPAALREALKIPFVDWLEPDDEETRRTTSSTSSAAAPT